MLVGTRVPTSVVGTYICKCAKKRTIPFSAIGCRYGRYGISIDMICGEYRYMIIDILLYNIINNIIIIIM